MPHLHTYDIIFQHVKKVRRARKNQTRAQNHSLHCFICGEYVCHASVSPRLRLRDPHKQTPETLQRICEHLYTLCT